MPIIRKYLPLFLVTFAVVATWQYLQHLDRLEVQRIAERDTRCAKQAATAYAPFKGRLECVGWSRIKSDIPLPAEG